MVVREKVVDPRGREWVTGALDAKTYFAEARSVARERARRTVAARLARGDKARGAGAA